MTVTIFKTERLTARHLLPQDVSAMLEVYGDADAMRWVGDGQPLDLQGCVEWLEVTRNNYRARGYGMTTLIQQTSGEVVGFCGLVHPGGQTEAEIKYAFRRRYWGQGLATEAARAMLAYGQRAHGVRRVIATTAPENAASHRVLLKAGMAAAELRRDEDGAVTQVFVWVSDDSTDDRML